MKRSVKTAMYITVTRIAILCTVTLASGDSGQNGFTQNRWTGAWGSDGPIFTGDLNGDHKTDVFMWREVDKSWTVNLSTGAGFNQHKWTGAWGSDGPIFTGDLNGDGKTDVFMWRDADKSWTVNLSTGSGFTQHKWTGAWGSDGPIFTGDLNGDGKTDVFMWRDADKSWTVNLSTGSGFTQKKWNGAWGSDGPIFTSDLNGDGKTDVFMWRDADKSWTVNLSTGRGFKQQKWTGAWGSDGAIRVADLNGDGKADVFMWRKADNSWTVNISMGTGFVQQRWEGACGGDGPVVIGDFNGDKRADVAVWRDDLKKWLVNLSLRNAFHMQQWTGAWGSDGPIHAGDLNGDGTTDVFMWRDIDKSWTVNLSRPVVLGPAAAIPGCGNPIWQPIGPHTLQNELGYLPAGGRIDAIAISPDYDGKGHAAMFIGNPGGGIMRWSENFPASSNPVWQALTDHLPFVTPETARININGVRSIAVHPGRPRTIFASSGGTPLGLFKSSDGGDTWSMAGQGQFTGASTINAVTIDSTGRIYVAFDRGFYVSEDNGNTFANIASGGVTNASFDDAVFFAESQNSFAVFAAVIDGSKTNNVSGIWQVTSLGGKYQWTQVPVTLTNMKNAAFNSTVIAHIKLSATPGVGAVASFTTIDNNPGLLNVFRMVKGPGGYTGVPKWFTAEQFFTQGGYDMGVAIGEDGRTYGGGIGLAQSDDKGVLNLQDQFKNIHVDEHVIAAYGGRIYAGTDGGLYRFTPQPGKLGGASASSWEPLNSSTLRNFLSGSTDFSPNDPFDILVGNQDNGANHLAGGVWSWLPSNERDVVFFDHHPANNGKIAYVYDASDPGNIGLQKSYDGGKTLGKHLVLPLMLVPNFLMAFHPSQQNRFMLNFPLGGIEFTVKETTDGWEDAGKAKDLAPPIKGLGCPTALSYAAKFAYVSAGGAIFQFDGVNWKKVFQASAGVVVSIATDPNNPNAIYFATPAQVFRKPDQSNGLPWTPGNGGDLEEVTGAGLTAAVLKLALISNGPGKAPNLYAATPLGIFRTATVNGGKTAWARMGTLLPDTPISDIQVNSGSRMIYVATYGRGVWYTLDLQ
ncbi:MAG: VCBS repeat-containing protein [Acidobacteria bacterium]|nr:VCBS repeat-containing protein [Acidobacteriota bacterium]